MFECDRFGPEEDYYATYLSVGGHTLEREQLLPIMQLGNEAIMQAYRSPERYEDFPSVIEAFRDHARAPEEELPILERVFAAHEIGRTVPPAHQAFLRSVAPSHHLGIVSNLCARPAPGSTFFGWPASSPSLRRSCSPPRVGQSSPPPTLFRRALANLPPGAKVLFAGDSLERDIMPAKSLGMDTAWIAPAGSTDPAAHIVIESLPDLAFVAI